MVAADKEVFKDVEEREEENGDISEELIKAGSFDKATGVEALEVGVEEEEEEESAS